MKKFFKFATLPLLLFLTIGHTLPQRFDTRTVREQSYDRASVPDASFYLQKKAYPLKAGVCFTYDDGDSSFYTEVMVVCDSIAEANDDSIQIKATTGVMVSNIGSAATMTWAQLKTMDQTKYEIALHGTSEERFGSRNTGFSRTYLDSCLSDWQDSLSAHGIPPARSILLANHRFTHGMEDIYIENGVYNIFGTRISPSADTTLSGGSSQHLEQVTTNINIDPWPAASAATGTGDFYCMLRQGGVQNRWASVGRDGYSNSSDTLEDVKKRINLAVQTGSILNFSFHSVDDDTSGSSIRISKNTFRLVMTYVEDLMKAGVLNSYTAEEAMARGCGYVYGPLIPHYNFKRLVDLVGSDTVWTGGGHIPLGWPLAHNSSSFRIAAGDTFVTSAGSADRWKVWDLSSDGDTVSAWFVDEGLAADSVSYGAGDAGGRVLVATTEVTDSERSKSIPLFIRTTGVNANYVDVFVQVMYVQGTSVNAYLCANLYQWKEMFNDAANQNSDAYDFTLSSSPTAALDTAQVDLERLRIAPLFDMAIVDTSIFRAGLDGTANNETAGEWRRFARPVLRPFVIQTQGTHDMQTPWGDYTSAGTAGDASQSVLQDNYPAFDLDLSGATYEEMNFGQAHWITYHFRVEIAPMMTDWVAGHINFRVSTGDFSADPDYIVSNIQAVAPI